MSPSRRLFPCAGASGLCCAGGGMLLLGVAVLAVPLVRAQTQPTLLQRLRAMLGIVRPISVGGSRAALPGAPHHADGALSAAGPAVPGAASEPSTSSRPVPQTAFISGFAGALQFRDGDTAAGDQEALRLPQGEMAGQSSRELCLLSPWVEQGAEVSTAAANRSLSAPLIPVAVAITPSGAPPIASVTPLAEVQIRRGGILLWQGRGSSSAPLANPLAWPLPPLKPGELVVLQVRLRASDPSSMLSVELRRPAAVEPAASVPGSVPALVLDALLQRGRRADAVELLFQSDLAGNADLRQLARSAMASGCRGLSTQVPIGR